MFHILCSSVNRTSADYRRRVLLMRATPRGGKFHITRSTRNTRTIGTFCMSIMAAHEIDVFSVTDITEVQEAYAQIHLHEVCRRTLIPWEKV